MSEAGNEKSADTERPDAEEKKVVAVATRLPILIVVALLLMLGVGVLAVKMHGG